MGLASTEGLGRSVITTWPRERFGPRSRKWWKRFPEWKDTLNPSVRPQLDHGFALGADAAVRTEDGASYPRTVQKNVQPGVENKSAAGPVVVKANDLLGDLLITGEETFRTPDLRIRCHCLVQELHAPSFVVFGKRFVVRLEYVKERRFIHRGPPIWLSAA